MLALEIVSAENTLKQNKDAFVTGRRQRDGLRFRSSDANTGQTLPSGSPYIKGAQGAEMRGNDGYIFFNSDHPEKDIGHM